jgi:hypothetical protein
MSGHKILSTMPNALRSALHLVYQLSRLLRQATDRVACFSINPAVDRCY